MDHEFKKLMKLKLTEHNLANLLQKIDHEINQTDVQWMHLKSLIPASHKDDCGGEASSTLKSNIGATHFVKREHHIDDQSVNETQLNLSLKTKNKNNDSDEESD